MTKLLLISTLISLPLASFGQYCVTGGPSSGADSNLESLSLAGVTGSISYTGCPSITGVEEYLAQTAFLDAGAFYTANIQFGTCGGNYGGVGEAWIDFNQNLIFEPSESIGTWTGIPPVSLSAFGFSVPAGAATGATRMRVIQQEGGTLPIDPCASFTWGSVTDFSIYIQNGIDCSAYVGDDFSDPRPVAAIPYTENYDNTVCYSNQNTVYNSPDVYYLITPLVGVSSLKISLCGSSFDTFLTVTDVSGSPIAINDDYAPCGTQSQLSINVNGADSLYVIVEGWGSAGGAYTINITEGTLALDDISLDKFNIYPNPTNSFFKITDNFSGGLKLIDSNGRVIINKTISASESIQTGNLKSGIYFVHLMNNEQTSIQKLILK